MSRKIMVGLAIGLPVFVLAASALASGTAVFTIPTSTAPDLTGNIGATFGDTGLLTLVEYIGAAYGALWLGKRVLGFIPKSK